ncbi:hypothetical protein J7T55_002090 [Diaporthe amygdali]|uniref:uncharacterized protein n=1 Tax=Phomopsis amygdali TaxID=1214568 RepID=UPI0022FDC9C3|nr:uncharacterized protein J7T55_002090 [Diaporthe amygdali]KAJ0108486.1 hypothetical protein J7T55_002090 [Diaporthe amygdali]
MSTSLPNLRLAILGKLDWEFAACLLVLASPIIMFATVYPHNGQPLPRWPFSISINSLLSVYTLVLKSSIGVILTSCIGQLQWTWYSEIHPLTDMLRFDNATRGAAGALGLIWRQRFRRPLTVLGCVIMVLAVMIDPFVQQLVQPIDCSVEVSGDTASASLPRTNWFDFYGLDQNASSVSPQKAVESVMYNAVFSAGQDPPWQCSTGNCTFHVNYATIGVCYSCQDRSADVILNRSCSEPDASYASQHPTSATDCPANSSFSVDSSFHGDSSYKPSTKTAIGPDRIQDFLAVLADTYSELECEAECEQSAYLPIGSRVLFEFLLGATAISDGRIDWTTSDNSTCNSNEKEQSWACQGYGAATCSLYPCVKIYNATISAGKLEENLLYLSDFSKLNYGRAIRVFERHGAGGFIQLSH